MSGADSPDPTKTTGHVPVPPPAPKRPGQGSGSAESAEEQHSDARVPAERGSEPASVASSRVSRSRMTPVFSWPAPAGARDSDQKPKRARPGQDLIGALFETMHDVHFAPDFVGGVEFVLAVIAATVPCAAILIHVFDINTRQFVVVRAMGPAADSLVMHTTPGNDPVLETTMRHHRAWRIEQAASDPRFASGRWSLLGVVPDGVLSVPVTQAGRYLGAIELVNPDGGGGFYENEAHALDYIAEQFADFLANRPIVLEPDAVLPKA